jgi:hypothetical protein
VEKILCVRSISAIQGKRTPQMGVEVERKWKRADYHFPGETSLVQIQPAAPAGSK